MSRKILVVVLLTVAMMFVSAIAFANPDFSGSWTLNKDKSIGLQPGMEMNLTVKQVGNKIEVETKVVTTQGERILNDVFMLDEKETDFTPTQPNSKGKRTGKWLPRGNGIVVTDVVTAETDKGTVTILTTRKWILSPDGKELISDVYVEDQNGARIPVRRTFVKK